MLLLVSPGIITILCHAESFFPTAYLNGGLDHELLSVDEYLLVLRENDAAFPYSEPLAISPPQAENDFATTPEETPVTINVLANDLAGKRSGEGNDDDDDDRIDQETVDLDPDQSGTQNSLSTPHGTSSVNRDGYLTFHPAENFFGNSSILYTVENKDGETSNRATVTFAVSNVNDAPVIVSARQSIEVVAGTPVTLTLDNVVVSDPDNQPTTDFTLVISAGANYEVAGNTVTPSPAYAGDLPVVVRVGDGVTQSAPFTLTLRVAKKENVRPSITGQVAVDTPEDQALTITTAQLIISDPDDQSFTVHVETGDNYTVSGQTISPVADFSGTLSVPVVVNDGESSSEPFSMTITVTPVNDQPQVSGQNPDPLTTQEDGRLTISLANIIATDVDNAYPAGFTFTLMPGANYSAAGDVISPAPNYAGPLVVPVIVNDGASNSEPFNLQVNVEAVNDAPLITGQAPLTINESGSLALALSDLTVSDPDGQYPSGYTLSVLGGANYSVSQNVITAAPGFNGTLAVPVFVNDGAASSPIVELSIPVTPVNDPPVIEGQRALAINEETPINLSLHDLEVTDPDNPSYPEGFSLILQPGTNYSYSGTTVIPATNFTGSLSVNLVVNDGVSNSNPFALQISVLPLNDAPVITGQNIVTVNEDTPRAISFEDLLVNDPDNAYPAGFSLVVSAGANYTLSGNTVIPAPNYSGPLSIPVQVNDGLLASNIFNLSMSVSFVNDAPVITGQIPVQTAEDTPVSIQLSDLTVLDVDNVYPSGFTLLISPGPNYSVSGTTVTPVTDFNGTLNVGIMVNDGVANSPSFLFQVQVGNANDPPVITGQAVVSTNEETPVTLSLSHLGVHDPDNVFPAGFTLIVSPGVNYAVSGQTITPVVNFAGVLTIPVMVNDGVNNSASFDFKLQVNQVNDAPSFAAIPNQQIPENSPARTVAITGISKGPMEDAQQLTFVVTSGNTAIIENPVIQYNGTGTSAVLSYVAKPNTSGVVTITVIAIDNGSNVAPNINSYSSSFQVQVLEINSPPTLNVLNNISLLEDAEQQNITLTGITAGPGESQSLNVTANTSNPVFFELLEVAYISPETTGLLQFKSKPNVFGTVQITVTVTDNGSGVSPHVNTITRTFTLVIQPVNDPPVFTSTPVVVAAINENYVYTVTATDPDGEAITILAPARPAWATLSSSGNGRAILSGTPSTGAVGAATVTLQAKDATTVVEQTFSLYVNVRPVISSITLAMEEDASLIFGNSVFTSAYSDANGNPMASLQITELPVKGALVLSDVEVKAGDTISVASLPGLRYTPNANYFGADSFGWRAHDGYHFSNAAMAKISILSINDPPEIIFQDDTLRYEVNGEPAFLAALADIIDPDDDTLTHASIGFQAGNFRPDLDVLEFQNTTHLRGNFDLQTGILVFSGRAPLAEYRTALRSVKYLHLNTIDPLLTPRTVSFAVHDGEIQGATKDKVIMLQYTFVEFEIPSGFTPNGDNANDTWIIDRPGGGLEEMDNAIISVYNKQGVLVFRRRGFEQPWDGTTNGELLPADSYFFTIDLQLRNKKTYKGIVTILR